MRRFLRRRAVWALALSLVLHAALVLVLVLAPPERPPAPPPRAPIELELVRLEPPAPAQEEEVKPAAPAQPPRPSVREPTAEAAPWPGSPSPLRGERGAPEDAPRSLTLTPQGELALKHGQSGLEPEAPRGRTVVNGPGEAPDPVAMADYDSEKLGRRTNAMVQGLAADARARTGLVDPYFTRARSALEGDLSAGAVPLPKEQHAGTELVKGYLKGQENFGKTGNPYGDKPAPEWTRTGPLARAETQGPGLQAQDMTMGTWVRQGEQRMAAMDMALRAADHAWLIAVLELVQEPGGGIADAHIVRSSGYPPFDEYVLHRARKTFLELEDPPEKGFGVSPDGWRTLWKFSYYPMSIAEQRGQRVRVELLRVESGQGSGNPMEHIPP